VTPPALDAAMVQAKLRLMRELLDDLDAAAPTDASALQGDRMLRHAVERILTQLVEQAAAVNAHLAGARLGRGAVTYRASFDLAVEAGALPDDLAQRLLPSAGLRHVHQYAAVDLDLARTDYRAYVRAVAAFLPN
jgi:uncharacterized protein YutE (UPF0331/DUF86 family)